MSSDKNLNVKHAKDITEITERRNSAQLFNNVRKAALLKHVLETGNVRTGCALVGIRYEWFQKYLEKDLRLRTRVAEAEAKYIAELEKAAYERAVKGTKKGVYHMGKKVGEETVYSDKLLSDLLQASDSERYGKKSKVDNTTNINVEVNDAQNKLASLLGLKPIEEPKKKKDDDAVDADFEVIPD